MLDLGEDVVATRDAELDRVAAREPELVDPVDVARVGDRDPEPVAVAGDRDRDDPLQGEQGHELACIRGDALRLEVDEREVVAPRERTGDALGLCVALVAERLGQRAGAGATAGGGEPVAGDDLGRRDEIRDEIRDRLEPARGPQVVRGRPGAIAEIRGRAKRACGLEIHARFPRTRYRQPASHLKHRGQDQAVRPRAPLRDDGSRVALPEDAEIPVEDRVTEEQGDDGPEGEERRRTGSRSCAPSTRGGATRTSAGTSAAKKPIMSATVTDRPSIAPSRSASLTSPIPMPFG